MSQNRSKGVGVRRGEVAWITVDNSAKLNTLDSALMEGLADAIEELAKDGALRVMIPDRCRRASFHRRREHR